MEKKMAPPFTDGFCKIHVTANGSPGGGKPRDVIKSTLDRVAYSNLNVGIKRRELAKQAHKEIHRRIRCPRRKGVEIGYAVAFEEGGEHYEIVSIDYPTMYVPAVMELDLERRAARYESTAVV